MNKKDLYAKYFISQVDSKMLAKTYADYAAKLAEVAAEKVAYISDIDDELYPDGSPFKPNQNLAINVTLADGTPTTIVCSLDEIKTKVKDCVNSDGNEMTLQSIDGISSNISFDELSNQLEMSVTQLQLSQIAYDSLGKNDAGSYFSNSLTNLGFTQGNLNAETKTLLHNLHSVIASAETKVNDKVEALGQFFGFDKANEDAATLLTDDFDVTQYTGIKPVASWMAGLDINLGALTDAAKVVVGVGKQVWKGVKKVAGWLFDKAEEVIVETFEDPVDYIVDGSTLGYFKIPAKVRIPASYWPSSTDPNLANLQWYYSGFNTFMFSKEVMNPYYINCHSCMYRILRGDDQCIYYERYVRPVDYRALLSDLKAYDYTRISGFEALLDALSQNDYVMSSKASELEVYRGICFAYALGSIWSYSLYDSMYNSSFTTHVIRSTGEFSPSDFTGNDNLFYVLPTLLDQIKEAARWCVGETGNQPFLEGVVGSLADDLRKTSVTNADFVDLVTRTYAITNNVNTRYISALDSTTYPNNYYKGYINITDGSSGIGSVEETTMIRYHYPILYFAGVNEANVNKQNYGLLYMPYLHASDVKFDTNVTIKTDAMNAESINNLVVGVITAAVVIAAFAITKGVVKKLKVSSIKNQATYNASLAAVGQAVASGDNKLASRTAKNMLKIQKKQKITNTALGLFGAKTATDFATMTSNQALSFDNLITNSSQENAELKQQIDETIDIRINDLKMLIM